MLTSAGLMGLFAFVLGLALLKAQPCQRDRAMWIYQCPYDVVRDPIERQRLFEFADRNRVGEFFLSVSVACDPSLNCRLDGANYRAALHDFLGEAHRHQARFRVQALFGDKRLALRENHNKVRAIIRAIVDFNNQGPEDQRFDGVHSDVEPHTLTVPPNDQYRQDPIGTLRQYLDMNAAILEEIAGQNLTYGVDIPDRWHPYRGRNGNLDARCDLVMNYRGKIDYPTMHLLNMVKSITVMSYYGDADTMIRKTKYLMDYAVDAGAKVYVGVQTSPPGRDLLCCPTCPNRTCEQSFFCGGRTAMEDALCGIDTALGRYSSFLGFAYFKYSSYADMDE